MDFQALIDELSDICTRMNENEKSPIQQLDNSKVWTTLFNVASNDMRNTALLYPMINVYASRFHNFREENKVIEKYVEDFLDESKNENERTLHSVAIFRWLSFLPSKLVPKIISSAIDITDKYLDEHKDVPFDFLLPLNDGELSDMEESTLDELFAQLQTAITDQNPKSAASLCVYSTMCHGMVDLKPEAAVFNLEILPKFFKSTVEKDQLCGCYYMIFLSECLADPEAQEAVPPPTDLFDLLKPLIVHKTNEHIRKRANKALIKFIQTEFFLTDEIVNSFLSLFDQYASDPSNLPKFFKVISNFIFPGGEDDEGDDEEEAENEVRLDIIQPIVDFIGGKLADKSNHMVQGLSLDSVCDLGFKDKIIIEDLVPIGLDVSKSLINEKEVATYPFIANFLTILKEKFQETVSEIAPLVPVIVSELNSESLGTVKQRIYCAGAIAQLLESGIATEETNNVIQFVLNNLNCGEEKSVFNLCSVVLPILKNIGEEKSNIIFKSFVEDVKKTENEEYLTAWLTCLGKFIKNYNIDEDSVNSVVALIMSGELKIYHGSLPHIAMPPIIAPFNFLRKFVKKYPTKAAPICSQIVEWLKFTPFSSMPTLLLPLIAGLESGCIDENLAKSLASILNTFLSRLDLGDSDPLASVCTALNSLYQYYKQVMTPIINYLAPLEKFAKDCYTENEGDDDMIQEELVEAMPAVATLTFNVYANDDEVKVLPGLINPLLALLPFHPQVEEVPEILTNICSMLENKDRFSDIVVNALKMFADVLLMKKADLNEFKFSDDLINSMKQTLKSYCKNDKRMTNAVTSDFRTSRAKVNRFNVLIR